MSKTVIDVGPTAELELEIKTYSSLGSGDVLGVSLHSSQGYNSGQFRMRLNSTPQYYLYCCQNDFYFPNTLPSALEDLEEYIWKISLNKTSSKLKVQCNEFVVLAMQLSDDSCTSSCWSTTGKKVWGREMKDFSFYSIDTASDYYRLNSLGKYKFFPSNSIFCAASPQKGMYRWFKGDGFGGGLKGGGTVGILGTW